MLKPSGTAVALVLIFSLAGCFEQPRVEVHKPGQYKGVTDPLLQIAGTAEQNDVLAKRFKEVQTDR